MLKPGGIFGVYEQMQVGERRTDLSAAVGRGRTVVVRGHLGGVRQALRVDRLRRWSAPRTARDDGPPIRAGAALSPAAVFGPSFAERIANNIDATRAGILAPIVMIARAI